MATKCYSSVRGRVARLTKVDECGKPIAGPCSTLTIDGFISIGYTPEIEEGDEITVKKANGALCVSDRSCDTLKYVTVEIEFCNVNPDIMALMTGNAAILDYKGDSVGNRVGTTIQCSGGFALEVWTDIPNAVCDTTGAREYGYFLIPYLTGGQIGEFTIENDAATITVSGYSKVAAGWGRGPYNVDGQDSDNTPGPLLTPFGPNDHLDMHLVTIPPPESTCGCQTLELPASYTTDTDGGGVDDNRDPNPNDATRGDGPPKTAPVLTEDTDDSAGTATYSWTAVTGAASYDILVEDVVVGNTTALNGTVAYDPADAPRTVTVRAKNGDGVGPVSNSQEAGGPPTAAPVLTRTSDTNEGSAVLSWTAVPNATEYDVLDSSGAVVQTVPGLTATVTYPQDSTETYTVRGKNPSGNGPASNTRSVGADFFPEFNNPGSMPEWETSTDSGATFAAPGTSPVVISGPLTRGQVRWRATYTIPAGYGGTYDLTYGGAFAASEVPPQGGEVFIDGVSQGVATGEPQVLTGIPATPGSHTIVVHAPATNAATSPTSDRIMGLAVDYTNVTKPA